MPWKSRERAKAYWKTYNKTRRSRPANILRNRDLHLRKKYGITLEEKQNRIKAQGNKCGCCGSSTPGKWGIGWHTDHDHDTKQLRDELCHNCNVGLGHAKDSIEILEKWIAYLRRHGK